jgi:competence protein ComEC
MAPLTLLWFKTISFLGIMANLLAVPWVSYLVLPYAFILILSWFIGESSILIQGFEYLIQILEAFLESLSHWSVLNFHFGHMNSVEAIGLLLLGGLFFWLLQLRYALLMLCLILVIFMPRHQILALGEFWVDVLDVGQGLAVMIRTKNHHLLYDTGGMRGRKTFAEMVILPYLTQESISFIDKIVISHPDLDHKAGLPLLRTNFPKAEIIVDNPKFYSKSKSCFHLKDWCWDEVCFHFIAYHLQANRRKNNHSCVLEIRNKLHQVWLTGDIEKQAEKAIIKIYQASHRINFLLVPHHGSLSSSTIKFLQLLKPKLAMVSLGLHNPYHHPHPEIVRRYHDLNIPFLTTAKLGMIRLMLGNQSWKYSTWR